LAVGVTAFKRAGIVAQVGAFCGVADLESLSRTELIAVIVGQQRQIEELKREIDQLRRGSGHAAPFSKGQRVNNPKRPGRKPGQGPFLRRQEPQAESGDAVVVEVPVVQSSCPDCGGMLGPVHMDTASVTDLPERPRPVVRIYDVEVRSCRTCGQTVRGRHPELAADQHGATAHRVGPRLRAAAHALHYGLGVPVRKVPAILAELTGIRLTQGAITQDALKQAERAVGAAYHQLRAGIRRATVVHTDDTGWRTGGETSHLMVFDTGQATVYQIRPQHRNEEVREVIPADYRGVMVTDRGKSYDAEELLGVAQQKCFSHLLRNVSDVLKVKRGRARQFGETLKELLQDALQLWHDHHEQTAVNFRAEARRLEGKLTHHLRNRILQDDDNQKLLNGIGTQDDRGHLLRFLEDPGIEPTNNRAERALRPAVIARKVSHCSKNQRGADAFAAFTSLAQTIKKTSDVSLIDSLAALIHRSPQSASP
jgi:transposase